MISAVIDTPWSIIFGISMNDLDLQQSPLLIGLLWGNPVHEHSARVWEVGAGEEVALAPADDEEVAHLELLALVDVVEGVVDGWRVRHRVEVGQYLCLVPVGDFVDSLHRAVAIG